ncbi:MAG TPA: Mur ligase family protein, partial [Rhizomicrobium sp.]|nr:Mur ligase family protein [Rhizomicrobium sp.]
MSLWTSAEAESATLGTALRAFEVDGLSIDTRTLKPGDLFVALKGDNRDGHDFVGAAFEAKAGAALVTHKPDGVDGPVLTVAHTQRGLEDLARAARARSNARIVAVTGSAGKTTTKEILRIALNALGRTHASAASYNNHWGVPLSLASLPRDAEYGVFEVGMNHFGELRNLVGFVKPHVALITTIAPAHLEFFGNCESIADAKSEIFEGLLPGGAALIPADSPYAERLTARARQAQVSRIIGFGEKGEAKLISFTPDAAGMRVKADIFGTAVDCLVGAPGAHIAQNVVGALASVALLEGNVLNAAAALKNFAPLKGRGARFDAGGVAVTGSAGKTTTKEILRLALNALGRTNASAASYNNHWGVPLSLASLPRDAEYGVFEVGMNHFGELRDLVGFVKPHVALITTIAPAHLEFFGNCESIADAKSEIFEGLLPGGAALIPADSAYADRLTARARQAQVSQILSFG